MKKTFTYANYGPRKPADKNGRGNKKISLVTLKINDDGNIKLLSSPPVDMLTKKVNRLTKYFFFLWNNDITL